MPHKNKLGNIYILSNPAMPGLLKIGYTRKSVVDRANELSNLTGVPVPFVIEYEKLVDSPAFTESRLHDQLQQYRIRKNKEFFLTDVDTAVIAVNKILYGKHQIFSLTDDLAHLIMLYEEYPEQFAETTLDINELKSLLDQAGSSHDK
jgi:hypothetical protein